jgi:hypothetical protein
MRTISQYYVLLFFLFPLSLPAHESTDSAAPEKEPGFILANACYTSNNSNNVLLNAIKMPATMDQTWGNHYRGGKLPKAEELLGNYPISRHNVCNHLL